jgi:hypothetical protein
VDRQFVALLMDHEGRFSVRAAIEGPAGDAVVESSVAATYDARPPLPLLFLYLAPFVLIAALWLRVLIRRRQRRAGSGDNTSSLSSHH